MAASGTRVDGLYVALCIIYGIYPCILLVPPSVFVKSVHRLLEKRFFLLCIVFGSLASIEACSQEESIQKEILHEKPVCSLDASVASCSNLGERLNLCRRLFYA